MTVTDPLVKSVIVPVDPTAAFALFTDRIAEWWPLETHSVWAAEAAGVRVEEGIGGHVVETHRDGRTSVWGTVTRWDPPHAVAFTWHPGRPEHEATHVTVRFAPAGEGTRVELTHGGWEARDDSAFARVGYDRGWEVVLGHLAHHVG